MLDTYIICEDGWSFSLSDITVYIRYWWLTSAVFLQFCCSKLSKLVLVILCCLLMTSKERMWSLAASNLERLLGTQGVEDLFKLGFFSYQDWLYETVCTNARCAFGHSRVRFFNNKVRVTNRTVLKPLCSVSSDKAVYDSYILRTQKDMRLQVVPCAQSFI